MDLPIEISSERSDKVKRRQGLSYAPVSRSKYQAYGGKQGPKKGRCPKKAEENPQYTACTDKDHLKNNQDQGSLASSSPSQGVIFRSIGFSYVTKGNRIGKNMDFIEIFIGSSTCIFNSPPPCRNLT